MTGIGDLFDLEPTPYGKDPKTYYALHKAWASRRGQSGEVDDDNFMLEIDGPDD